MTLCFPVEKISCVIQDPSRVSSWTCTHRVVASSGQPNYLSVRLQVPSHLNMQMWRALLLTYPDNIIFDLLEFGWPVGYCGEAVPVFALRNHRGALNFPAAVEAYLSSEDHLGRVAGPFDALPFDDAFVVSLLTSVPKRDSRERRVIVDLSWPCGRSVNDGIPRNSFFWRSGRFDLPDN